MAELHRWFRTETGQAVATAECQLLSHWLAGTRARTVLQLGAFGDGRRPPLLSNARQWLLDDDVTSDALDVEGDCRELPFATDAIDAVIIVHQLEFSDAPHDVLREVSRIVAPEGWLINLGFNPYSLWGLRRVMAQRGSGWRGCYYSRARIEDWLGVLGLAIQHRGGLMLRPPVARRALARLEPFERWGHHYARWLGGIHVTVARKHVEGMTPLPNQQRPRLEVIPGGLAHARVRPAARRRVVPTERR